LLSYFNYEEFIVQADSVYRKSFKTTSKFFTGNTFVIMYLQTTFISNARDAHDIFLYQVSHT